MKFNKYFKLYIIVWALLLVLFNLVTFLVPGEYKYNAPFFIGYALITLTFVGQLFAALKAFNVDSLKKLFLNIPIFKTSFTTLVLTAIFGSLPMVFNVIPYWVAIIFCFIILIFSIIAVLKAAIASDAVTRIDEKVKSQTFFIKALTVDADTLVAAAKSEEVRAECKKVYEAIRFSDPMSNEALASSESQITINFEELAAAVEDDDTEAVKAIARTVLVLLKDRNNKCKLLK